ncbi:MAG: hypothetical protein LC777_12705 [Actinobacteria bacterium]|nr:hypothetical protein [Actinomycetota bacterium]
MTAHPPVAPRASCSSTRTPPASWRVARHPAALLGLIILALTLLAATASALSPELGPTRGPHPTLHGTPYEALSILVGNARTLTLPLLLSAGRWHTHPSTRRVGDLLVAALVISNPVIVGLALGRHPAALPVYLPHLALEDGALAIAASAWLARRLPNPDRRPHTGLLACASLTLTLAAIAAILETYAVPHKG